MNYLLDTNIWLEGMLEQEHAADVVDLLARVPSEQLCMTDFTLHSIGVILHRLKQRQTYIQFVQDVLLDGATHLITLPPDMMEELSIASEKYRLDFDDAYQYLAAVRYDLSLVSLDSDFDRTDRGRRTPHDIIRDLDADVEDE